MRLHLKSTGSQERGSISTTSIQITDMRATREPRAKRIWESMGEAITQVNNLQIS